MNNVDTVNLTASEQIKAEALMKHVRVLAAPEMRGRMPGDIGYERACQYVEQFFQQIGLEPLGDNGTYRQAFTLETNRVVSAQVYFRNGTGRAKKLSIGNDFVCRGLTSGATIEAGLVFVGYGRENEQIDELRSVDLAGKIAVAFKYPAPSDKGKPMETPRARAHRFKAHGAIGLVIVPNPNNEKPDRLGASLIESDVFLPGFPMIVLSERAGRALFTLPDETLASLQYKSDMHNQVVSRTLPGHMRIEIDTEWSAHTVSWNVVGLLRGTDPELQKEAVIIGAHLDHVGIQAESVIFYGAQDDASGVAAMLEIARTFATGELPKRSLICIAFGAEEAGIIGSKHYGEHPTWHMNKIQTMINFDCMGAGIGMDLRGRKHHPKLFELVDSLNERYFHIPDTKADHGAGGADAEPFQIAGVPNMFVVAEQPYQHLHAASDIPDTLNPHLFESVTRLMYMTTDSLLRNGYSHQ